VISKHMVSATPLPEPPECINKSITWCPYRYLRRGRKVCYATHPCPLEWIHEEAPAIE